MRVCNGTSSRLAISGLCVILFAGCGGVQPPSDQAAAEPRHVETEGVTIFGLELGAPRAALLQRFPDLALTDDDSQQGVELGRVQSRVADQPIEIVFTIYQSQLANLRFEVLSQPTTFEIYRQVLAALETELGDGVSTRCVSEEGVPLDEYIATVGRGHLGTSWDEEHFWARLSLNRDPSPDRRFRVTGSISSRQVLLPCDLDMICEGEGADDESTAKSSKEATDQCRVDLSASPPGSIAGLDFGMTRRQVEAALGSSLDGGAFASDLPFELVGRQGRLSLRFYDGCLAALVFVIRDEGATIEAFRALHVWAGGQLQAQVDTARCESEEGVPLGEHIANGDGQLNAIWRESGPVEASLRLSALYGRRSPPELIFEASSLPLRPHAPTIDF
jgi:hypothetical protein